MRLATGAPEDVPPGSPVRGTRSRVHRGLWQRRGTRDTMPPPVLLFCCTSMAGAQHARNETGANRQTRMPRASMIAARVRSPVRPFAIPSFSLGCSFMMRPELIICQRPR